MYKQNYKMRTVLRWKRFSRKGYSLFSCLGKEVIVGTLSIATLSHAKAESVSIRETLANDSLNRKEVKLDEVIVTGSRAPLTALQTAKILSVVTRDDINRAAVETINDVLKLATGVDVRQRGGFGVQTDISINGGTFDQITILLNGVNISNPQTGHNAADFPVSLDDIERIEILEGASARVFGSSAFSGAINIITRVEDKSKARLSAQAGSYGTFGGDASLTIANSKIRNKISGGYTQSDGGTLNSDFKKRRGFFQGGYYSDAVNLLWQAGITSQDYGANTFYTPKFDNQYEQTRRFITSIGADIRAIPSKLTITPNIYWQRNYDHYQLIRGAEGAASGENYHRMDIFGASVNAHISWKTGKTSIGAEVNKARLISTAYGDKLPEAEWKDISGSERKYEREGNRTNTSIFLEHNIIARRFTISAGVLANRNTALDSDFRLYPGIDVSYRPTDDWKLYISWNKALRVPTFTDLYTDNKAQYGDINLKPEKNSTFKIGARYRHKGFEAAFGGFYSIGRNMIDWVLETDEDKRFHALNIGKLDNMGVSADATFNPDEYIPGFFITRIKAGYAYINQKHETEYSISKSLYALEYLRHKFTMAIDHRIFSRLTASWTLRWQQRMNGYHPYTKLDCKLQWNADRYNIYVKADNITAHRYYDIGSVKQPGLWIMAGASFNIGI